MGDAATLLTAIAAVITALGTALAVNITAIRSSRKERPRAARKALELLAAAAVDGELDPDEIRDALAALAEEDDQP